jgi:hypothetical protein
MGKLLGTFKSLVSSSGFSDSGIFSSSQQFVGTSVFRPVQYSFNQIYFLLQKEFEVHHL